MRERQFPLLHHHYRTGGGKHVSGCRRDWVSDGETRRRKLQSKEEEPLRTCHDVHFQPDAKLEGGSGHLISGAGSERHLVRFAW